MRGFCTLCGCGIDHHHDVEYISDGKAHEECVEDHIQPRTVLKRTAAQLEGTKWSEE